ncbi:transposase [Streptomyces gardneri]|uniref:transposase n=1 Tax=Streptomyces gardneri TaxID=66892 RepID=UPI00369C5B45
MGRDRRPLSGLLTGRQTGPGLACSSRSRSATTPSGPWSGTVSVDSTASRAHQHAAGARKKKGRQRGMNWKILHVRRLARRWAGPAAGLTTKVHLACDVRGLPLAVVVPPGNVNDSTVFAVMDAWRVPRACAGPPRRRPDSVIADKTSHADKSQAAAALSSAEDCWKAAASS